MAGTLFSVVLLLTPHSPDAAQHTGSFVEPNILLGAASACQTLYDRSCEGFRMPAPWRWCRARRGRRPQTSKGGNRGTSGNTERQTLWGFRRAVRCPRGLTGCLGSGRWGGETGRPIATGITGVARRRLIDKAVVQGDARASMVMAGREAGKEKWSDGGCEEPALIMMCRS